MKKGINWITMIIVVLSLGVNTPAVFAKSAVTPLISATSNVKMEKNTKVLIEGSGFRPGQLIILVYTDPNGVLTNIGYALKPTPVADSKGEWSTTWNCWRYIRKKIINEGVSSIIATDDEYNIIAHDSVYFHTK